MSKYFISCDWGSSNLRLYLVEAASLELIAEYSDENGIKVFFQDWQQSGQERETFYLTFLEDQIKKLGEKAGEDLSAFMVTASGMITSSLGLKELPYASIPKKLVPDQLITDSISRFTLISGIKSEYDVMRGEETLILGILGDHPDFQGTIILPGTHSKHAILENGVLEDFHTYLTGEIFQLLVKESSLSHTLEACKIIGVKSLEKSFLNGVQESINSNLLNKVFHARANSLLKNTSKKENFAFLSGILIGSEIQNISDKSHDIILCGNIDLCALYTLALHLKDIKSVRYCSDKTAMIKGHSAIMKQA